MTGYYVHILRKHGEKQTVSGIEAELVAQGLHLLPALGTEIGFLTLV